MKRIATNRRQHALLAACAAAGLFALAPAAHAGPAAMIQENKQGELNRADVFEHLFGGTFMTTDHETFASRSVTATPTAADEVWGPGKYEAAAVARFAASTQVFGTYGPSGYVPMFDTQGTGFDVGGGGTVNETGPFEFWRSGDFTSLHLSLASGNADGRDHMVTYEIAGLDPTPGYGKTWLLFWEDLDLMPAVPGKKAKKDKRTSADYNDLVVELREVVDAGPTPQSECEPPPPAAVPLPAGAWPGLAVLGAVATFARRRRATA